MSAPKTGPIQFPEDPRVEHRYASLNDRRYHYLFAEPKNGPPKATVFLVSSSSVQLFMTCIALGLLTVNG
jgi:hypothetical protein